MRIKAKYFAAPALAALMLGGGAAWTHSGSSGSSSSGNWSRSNSSGGDRAQGCAPALSFGFDGIDGFDIPPILPFGVPVHVLDDGSTVYADGTIVHLDGTVEKAIVDPNGFIQLPGGNFIQTLNPGT